MYRPDATVRMYAAIASVGGILAGAIALLIGTLYIIIPQNRRSRRTRDEKLLQHVVITGGSSGIGLSIARACLKRTCSCRVTLLARDKNNLNKAKEQLELELRQQKAAQVWEGRVVTLSVDVTNFDELNKLAKDHITSHGPATMLFNVAGTSSAATFVNTATKEFHRLININYLGSVNATKVFLPYMLERTSNSSREALSSAKKDGCGADRGKCSGAIIFTSSAAGQLGTFGYTAYSASKFALRGLAEALSMELHPQNISVTVTYPPDTDTPGYKLEMDAGKPKATALISQVGGLFSADMVGEKTLQAALEGRSTVYFGLEGWMLSTLTAGMSPVNNMVDALCQVCLMGILRLISLFYLMDFRRIVEKCDKTHEQNDNSSKEK